MVAILLSLIGLLALPIAYAQTNPPAASPAQSVRTERVRATASFPVVPEVSRRATTSVPVSDVPAVRAKALVAAPTVTPAPAAKPAQAPAPAPSSNFAQDVEREILRLVNIERANEGLGTLAADAKLAQIARAHSKDMLANDYFSHTDESGCGSSCRVSNAGYAWQGVGENIYTMTGYDMSVKETARHMVEGWMDSAGHRANILKEEFTHHGVGLAVSGKTIYATSVFALPK